MTLVQSNRKLATPVCGHLIRIDTSKLTKKEGAKMRRAKTKRKNERRVRPRSKCNDKMRKFSTR